MYGRISSSNSYRHEVPYRIYILMVLFVCIVLKYLLTLQIEIQNILKGRTVNCNHFHTKKNYGKVRHMTKQFHADPRKDQRQV